MYQLTPDGARALWLDAFGLSRLDLPGRSKTLRQLQAGDQPLLTTNTSGTLALAHATQQDQAWLVSTDSLQVLRRYECNHWERMALHPDGEHILVLSWYTDQRALPAERCLSLGVYNEERKPVSRLFLEPSPANERPAQAEDPTPHPQANEALLFQLHHDGAFAVYDGEHSRLYYGHLQDHEPLLLWHERCHWPYHEGPHLFPARDGLCISTYENTYGSTSGQTHIRWRPASLDERGWERALSATGPAQRAGQQLAYPTPDDIVLVNMSDLEIATERFDLTTLHQETQALGYDVFPTGALLFDAGQVLWLPGHGEFVFDFRRNRALHRGLPTTQVPLRRKLMQRWQHLEQSARSIGLYLRMGAYASSPHEESVSLTITAKHGEQPLLEALLIANIREELLTEIPAAFDCLPIDCSAPELPDFPPFTLSEVNMRALFDFASEHNLRLRPFYQHFLKEHYLRCLLGEDEERHDNADVCAPADEHAQKILIGSLVEALGTDLPRVHLARLPLWQEEQPVPERIFAQLRDECGIDGSTTPGILHTMDGMVLVLGHHFRDLPIGRSGDTLILHDCIPGLDAALRKTPEEEPLLSAVRGVLALPPTRRHFTDLMDLFDEADPDELELAAAYAAQHLDHWPDELRTNPGWLDWHEAHPAWALIRHLDLLLEQFSNLEEELRYIQALPCFAALSYLGLGGEGLKGTKLAQFTSLIAEMPKLRCLHLTMVAWSPIEASHFASRPQLAQIKSLRLPDHNLSTEARGVLLDSPYLSHIEELELSYSLRDLSFWKQPSRLFDRQRFPSLRRLHLHNWSMADKEFEGLASSEQFPQLKELSLEGNYLAQPGAEALITSPHLQQLKRLALRNCRLHHEALLALVQNPSAERLTHLDLRNNFLLDDSLISIVESPYLQGLQKISLQQNQFTDEGLVPFLCAEHLPFYSRLSMLPFLTKKGLTQVARHFGIKGLSSLRREVQETRLKEALIAAHEESSNEQNGG